MPARLPCRSPHPPPREEMRRVVLCSGKLYYELDDKREKLRAEGKANDVAIVRMEQVGGKPHRSCHLALFHHLCFCPFGTP